jgi:endoglycosylceramidase
MNVLRLLFTWEAYEPQPGHYDAQYLRYIEDVVDEAEREGLYVIVDFHQDAFSRFTNGGCGEGFPAWALPPDLTPLTPDNGPRCKLWGLRAAFAPHAKRAWEAFYAGEGLARERFLVMVERVARRMAQHPAVIGYDLLNEPWGDEVEQLAPLYEDEARVLRRADPSAILFVTPGALTVPGQRSKLPKPTFDNFAFAPHYYDIGISGVHVWTGRPAQQAFAHMAAVADVWNVPVFVGEFGAPANAWGGVRYLHGIWHQMDDRFYSGAQWVYTPQWDPVVKDGWNLEDFSVVDDRGQVRRNFSPRPYPARIAGEPLRFAIHEGGQGQGMDIELRWQHDPARGVTRVAFPEASAFVPERLHLKATSADVSCRWQGVGVACSSTVAGPKTVLFSSH